MKGYTMEHTYLQLKQVVEKAPEFREKTARAFVNWKITNKHEAALWIIGMTHAGVDFHWDENPSTIIDGNGKKLFSVVEAAKVRRQQQAWFQYGGWALYEDKVYGKALCTASGLTYDS